MASASEIRRAVYDWLGGDRVVEHGGWQNRTSPGGWSPNGIMHHWTAMGQNVSPGRQADVLMHGRPGLPGPLCHFGTDWHGRVHLIGVGNCNHAGTGDSRVLREIVAGRYNGTPEGSREDSDGNPNFYGIEHMYHPDDGHFPDPQFEAGVLLTCAIGDAEGWTDPDVLAGSTLDHYEWTPGKWDREVQNLANRTRREVRETMRSGGAMPSAKEIAEATVAELLSHRMKPFAPDKGHSDGLRDVAYYLKANHRHSRLAFDQAKANAEKVGATQVEVDEAALAAELLPGLLAELDPQAIADAVAEALPEYQLVKRPA